MAKKKASSEPNISVSVGGNVGGEVNVAGRDLHITESTSDRAAIETYFETLFQKMDALKSVNPQTVVAAKPVVEEIKAEALKGNRADEILVANKLRLIAQMGPDILDVVTATLANPMAGISAVIQKVAKKAREEQELK